jgi:hypothetical protein
MSDRKVFHLFFMNSRLRLWKPDFAAMNEEGKPSLSAICVNIEKHG